MNDPRGTSYERCHALSDVITAVLDAGLTLELLHEQSYTNAPWPWAERGEDGYYRLPEGWPRSHSRTRFAHAEPEPEPAELNPCAAGSQVCQGTSHVYATCVVLPARMVTVSGPEHGDWPELNTGLVATAR